MFVYLQKEAKQYSIGAKHDCTWCSYLLTVVATNKYTLKIGVTYKHVEVLKINAAIRMTHFLWWKIRNIWHSFTPRKYV